MNIVDLINNQKSISSSNSAKSYQLSEVDVSPRKLPPQVVALLRTAYELTEQENRTFTMKELGYEAVERGHLKTRQDPHRIAVYYKKQLEDLGLLEL